MKAVGLKWLRPAFVWKCPKTCIAFVNKVRQPLKKLLGWVRTFCSCTLYALDGGVQAQSRSKSVRTGTYTVSGSTPYSVCTGTKSTQSAQKQHKLKLGAARDLAIP